MNLGGGGISVYVKDSYSAYKLENISVCTSTIESCIVKVRIGEVELVICGIYRPHSDSIDSFTRSLELLISGLGENAMVVIAGDMNVNLAESSPCILNYVSMLNSLLFLPAISLPTRFPPDNAGNIAPSTLDHIFINKFQNFLSGVVGSSITDHAPVFIFFNINPVFLTTLKKIQFRPFSEQKLNLLKTRLSAYAWDTLIDENINESWKRFLEKLNNLYCSCFPLKTKFISDKRLSKPWLTTQIKQQIKEKSRYFWMFRKGYISKETNNRFKNRVNELVNKAKTDYHLELFSRCRQNIKKKWRLINNLIGKRKVDTDVWEMIFDEQLCSDKSEILEKMNSFFTQIATNLDNDLPNFASNSPTNLITRQFNNYFYLFPVSNDECCKVIKTLKLTKTELNEIPVRIFKDISIHITTILTRLLNSSFLAGIFPAILKVARITQVFKSGDRKNPSNYRPISSLPFLSKIYERCLYNRLISFSDKFKILCNNQYGFRKKLSTSDALIHLTENIYQSLNDKCHHVSILIDLKKAFDTVNHQILMDKLFFYGIRGLPHQLIKSYLSDRTQFLQRGSLKSSIKSINIGVPQGSILGPLFFLFYVNDLPNFSNSLQTILFADDTVVSLSHKNSHHLSTSLNTELQLFQSWTIANRLTINVTKTKLIKFSNILQNNIDDFSIRIGDEGLDMVSSCRYLGVLVDEKLNFSEHISTIVGKIARSTGILYKIKNYMPLEARINFYYAFIFPFLSYCILVWGGTCSSHLKSLIIQQKKVIRIISNAPPYSHTSNFFHTLKILKFNDIYKYQLGLYMYKSFDKFKCTHPVNTRNRNLAVPAFQRLTQTQRSVSFRGPHIWNELPAYIRAIDSLPSFKRELKNYLISLYAE